MSINQGWWLLAAVAGFDLLENSIHIAGRIGMANRRTNSFHFFSYAAVGFSLQGRNQFLPHPFGNGDSTTISCTLDCLVFGILQRYLKSFSHSINLTELSA
jgi:hypothetical protein